jgi:hypothetical protein
MTGDAGEFGEGFVSHVARGTADGPIDGHAVERVDGAGIDRKIGGVFDDADTKRDGRLRGAPHGDQDEGSNPEQSCRHHHGLTVPSVVLPNPTIGVASRRSPSEAAPDLATATRNTRIIDTPALVLRITIPDPIQKKDSASQCHLGCVNVAYTKVLRQVIESHEGGADLPAGAGA